MPSVAAAKQAVQEPAKNAAEVPESFRNLQMFLERKIRNLEKKKNRLDEYQKRKSKGETLEPQQVDALATMGTVVGNLEFARETLAQVNEQGKVAKKMEKKQRIEREKSQIETIKNLLGAQSLLDEFRSDETRALFSEENATAGLVLTDQQLCILAELQRVVSPRREEQGDAVDPPSWDSRLQQCAENCVNLIEGRDRQLSAGTSYRQARQLVIEELAQLPYFTAGFVPRRPTPPTEPEEPEAPASPEPQAAEQPSPGVEIEEEFHDAPLSPPENAKSESHALPIEPQLQQQQQEEPEPLQPESLPQPPQCTLTDLQRKVKGKFEFIMDSELERATPPQEKAPVNVWNSKPPTDWSAEEPQAQIANATDQAGGMNQWSDWSASSASAQATATAQSSAPAAAAAAVPVSTTSGVSQTDVQREAGAANERGGASGDVFSSATQSDYLKSGEDVDEDGFSPIRSSRGGGLRARGVGNVGGGGSGGGGFRGRGGAGGMNFRGRPPRGAGPEARGGGFRGGRGRGGEDGGGFGSRGGRGSSNSSSYHRPRGGGTYPRGSNHHQHQHQQQQ